MNSPASTPVVLDPACGDGALLEAFTSAWGAPSHLVGIDLNRDAIQASRALKLPNATLLQADALAPTGTKQNIFPLWRRGLLRAGIERVDAVIANLPCGAGRLDQEWFTSLSHAKRIIEAWRTKYNTLRPPFEPG